MSATEHENRQTMEIKDTCLCEERFIDRSILVTEILKGEGGGALCATPVPTPPPPPLWLHKPHKPMANRVQLILCVIFVSCLLCLLFLYSIIIFKSERNFKYLVYLGQVNTPLGPNRVGQ